MATKRKAATNCQFDLQKYENEAYLKNPLLSFHINKVLERRHYTILKSHATAEKIKICRKPIRTDLDDDLVAVSAKRYAMRVRQCTERTPVPRMLYRVERQLLSYISARHRKRYPHIVQTYMDDVHAEYNKIMRAYSLQKILRPLPGDYVPPRHPFNFKYLGRTPNYAKYLRNRERLQKRMFLPWPFIRSILNYANTDFPAVMNDYGAYRLNKKGQPQWLEIIDFETTVTRDLGEKVVFLKQDWYPKLVRIIKKYYRRHVVQRHLWPSIFACAKGLINRQLTEFKMRTFQHIEEVLLDRIRIPFLKLDVHCTTYNMDFTPSFQDIYDMYCKVYADIATVASQLPLLEINVDPQWQLENKRETFLHVQVTEGYMRDAEASLHATLRKAYAPLLVYLEAYRDEYRGLFGFDRQQEVEVFLTQEHTYEEYFEKVEEFREYDLKLRRRIQHQLFDMATVNETKVIAELREMVRQYIADITVHIVEKHRTDATEICATFAAINARALEIPTSTEMLLANGDYMLQIKTKDMFVLQARIQESLKIGGLLIELTDLSPEHVALQIETIRWYSNMKAIFDKNASLFENYKSQFEEHLSNVKMKLVDDLAAIVPKMTVINDMTETEKFRDYMHQLNTFIAQLKCFADYIVWINKEEKLFKLTASNYEVLEELRNYVEPFGDLMQYCIRWLRYYNVWMYGPFEFLVPTFVEETIENYTKEFMKMQKAYRNRIKQDMIGAPVCKFKGQSEDPNPDKHPVPLRLCARMIQSIRDFKTGAYIVNIMCNPALRTRHWEEMSEVAEFDLTPDAGTTLAKIMDFGLNEKLESFEIISVGANKELALQTALAAMIKEWEPIVFPISLYKETGIPILSGLDDIQALLDDHIIKTLTMRGSAFVRPCEEEVRNWYEKLTRVNKTIEEWGKVQSNWLYLLPIFSSKDIVAQMPEEGRLFVAVDQTFRRNMTMIQREPLVMESGPAAGVMESLEAANVMLEDITNGVNNYLEKKRLYFPRFFFLANDEMLEILSETKDPLRVQPHLSKCFEGIYRLHFDPNLVILSMLSRDKENIEFSQKISTAEAKGSVEKWLLRVEEEMLYAIRYQSGLCYADYVTKSRIQWVLEWPQMVVLCISQVYWAVEVHRCLQSEQPGEAVKEFALTLASDLNDIVTKVRSKDISNLNRITIKSLIVIDVHAKDVIDELIKMNVQSLDDFLWLSQLRYYWEDEMALVRIINATVPFANEYLGNSDRLVITPLTDRCYRTLVGAYQLHLNGAPEGPAGTGKTETTKDLAKALAVQCKVFNCSDGLDYKAMGKFFKGLASAGAWACFDEFNRIELEVLSVVAQQILCIIVAVRTNVKTFVFEGTELVLNPACYVCITMNPGYAGRSELPDNLKVLFRTVAMMVPDYAMIGEISLYSYGFINARKLAVKIVTTYRLCSEQLSSQNHYDYGMRAVKTVLSACGNIKQAFPDEDEDILLLRSLIDVNLPKFLSFDVPLFEGIISDLFPGITLMATDYSRMHAAFLDVCEDSNLQPEESFFNKIIQTFEMMIVRHGFMMVGDPFAGKSVTLVSLAKILAKMEPFNMSIYHRKCELGIVNPKSITMGQLYGAFDAISYEWTDGIGATIYRNFATDTSENRKWLIFDGPIDAVWIENMNTVLDDNKKLCLTSGEVITMSFEMSMIFEVMDLSQASPATVSRCGMIYMEPVTLGWQTFAKSWINQCNPLWMEEYREFLMELFVWVLPTMTSFAKRNCVHLLYPGEFNLLMTTMSLFEMLLDDAVAESPEDYEKFLISWFQAAMVYSVVWGIGGLLNAHSRDQFDELHRSIWNSVSEENPAPGLLKGRIDVSLPGEGNLAEYMYVFKQKGAWKLWPDLVRRLDPEISATGIQVQTIDTGRYMHLLDMHIRHKRKILFVGPTGTGKSFYTQNMLMNKLDPELYLPAFITFTVMITANQTQNLLLSKLTKLKRGIYGPPKGKTCVIFVDDMNMPAKEEYGAQPPIELLRQYFDYGHFYDLKDTSKLFMRDILVLCACGLPGGSRQDVYARFLCHFNAFSINDFTPETMQRIFNNVLLIGLKKNGHASDVILPVQQIVNATLHVYHQACSTLRPTPAKSHYIFNLRDVSRLCGGCSLLRKESVDNKKVYAKIWFHEAMRVFYDRLIEESDRNWFFELLSDCIRDFFRDKMETVFEAYVNEEGRVTLACVRRVMFGTYMDMDNEPIDRRYEEVPSVAKFYDVAMLALDEYNATHKSRMDIVLFSYALEHLNKICRIMSMPAGSSLLVGMGGSGRQSLTKLAASICMQNVFQPEITKNYDMNSWREDLKKVLKESGGRGKDLVFLFTENQIKLEAFLTDIDCLLNLGEVPNIWPIDEKQEILELVRLAAQGGNRNIDISPLQVFSYFVNRCKEKLHLILCFSPIGSAFRTRIRLYPSLVNCCTIDWYDAWPSESLEMVANMYMTSVNIGDDIKVSLSQACQHFHVTALDFSKRFFNETSRITYITSASYLALIRSFCQLMEQKQTEIMGSKMRYVGGLDTLASAAESVAIMQVELNALQPKLIVMAEQSRVMSADIEKNTIEASIATEQVKKDELVANAQAAQAAEMEEECSKDLAMAVPVLEEALSALNTLKPADITLVKSMKNPPAVVKLVMAAVCIMKGFAPDKVNDPASGKKVLDYWGPSKRMMSDMGFLQSLKDYEKDDIKPEIMKLIRKDYIPNKDFQPHIVAKASSAAEGLCKWIIAIDMYDAVAKVVAPKKAKLYAAKEMLRETKEYLAAKRALALELEVKVAKLNEDLAAANAQKQRLEDEAEMCKNKLIRASTLIGSLGGEKSRWTASANMLQGLYDKLAGDVMVSCGVIAYLAPLTMPFRLLAVENWHAFCKGLNIPCSEEYCLTDVLGSEIKIQSWNLVGLPRDTFSTENAIIMDNSSRCSLFIDPQEQANKWIKRMEKPNKLHVLKFSNATYMKVLETCLEHGYPALIENVMEDVEAPLDVILMKSTFKSGGVTFISLGENAVPLSPKFKLYLTSNLRNPHYLPETFNKVTVINFALTQQGLEDQLLGIAVAKERPDLQELREKLIVESAANKAMLNEVELNILRTLSSSKGDILEDESAVRILDNSKILSVEIQEKQEAAKITEEKIDIFRQSYRPLAVHSSILYYCITDLQNIDPMYQFSLNWYINLYIFSIENANKSKDLMRRLKFLMDAITQNLYNNVCRSIFEKDKLLFSLILTTKILLASKQIDRAIFTYLLVGGTNENPTEPNPAPKWINEKMWIEIFRLKQLPILDGFMESMKANLSEWQHYFDVANPHLELLPEPWQTKLTAFERLVVLRAFRPDKLAAAIREYVQNEMGASFVTPPQFDIAKSFEDSNCLTPLVFILSPGADPMGSLLLFTDKMGRFETFQSISLGQGQGPIARKMIEEAQMSGSWVCLQNCHLAASWMPTLVEIWEEMDIFNTNSNFRMWLTSYPSTIFPPAFLQNGVKMTNEPPTGLQQNLLRSYLSEPINDPSFYEGCPGKDKAFSRILYGICFFHAVVQERKKFGALGWNIMYEFNDSDLHISVKQLQMLLIQYEKIPYTAICYLTGECNYGGRVTDAWDRRLIVSILANFVNDASVNDMTYQFADDKMFALPRKVEHREVVKYIGETLPNAPSPEVYGLHTNAGITRDLNMSNLLLDTMTMTQDKMGGGGGDSGGAESLASVVADIVHKLPPNFDIEVVEQKYPIDYNESMNTVLVQEMKRFNKLLAVIRVTSVNLSKSIEGVIVQTIELESIANSIAIKKTPKEWMKFSYPSLKPVASYVQDFVDRLLWLHKWYEVGKPNVFWLPGFFFTQAFLTAAMQNYARKYRIPIDTLCYDFSVLKVFTSTQTPAEGVFINGLFIEGARWNLEAGILDEQHSKVLVTTMPIVHLTPCLVVDLVEGTRYKCPMYKTAERKGILSTTGHSTNYVLFLLFNTNKPAIHWIKRSAALICQTND